MYKQINNFRSIKSEYILEISTKKTEKETRRTEDSNEK